MDPLFVLSDYQIYEQSRRKKFIQMGVFLGALFMALFFIVILIVGRAPKNFPANGIVTIPQNTTGNQVATLLYEQGVIRSPLFFKILDKLFVWQPLQAGDYKMTGKQHIIKIVQRVAHGDSGNVDVRITFPEGSTVNEIAAIVKKEIPSFDEDTFKTLAAEYEGFLFPDTYFVYPSITPDELLARMQAHYHEKMERFQEKIKAHNKTEREIIIMASLLEKEAFNGEEARIVSGILWKRIEIGMALQVDAPFKYIAGKTSAELTLADLDQDGPYNTYTRTGLPAGPIGNPGEAAIEAALEPTVTPYLFYLHDENGKVHYARTHDEHVANKQRYLR